MLLDLREISVRYGKASAIECVSLHVDEGEIVTILGANGAGKTTIARAITGQKAISSGQIFYNNERIDRLPAYKIARMGIAHIPSGRMIFSSMSVNDNLLMGAFVDKDKHRIIDNLEKVYNLFPILRDKRLQSGGELSGGQQQMLAIGRALMSEPRCILMDEPSMGLSPMLVAEVAEVIRQLHRQGNSILLVEQNARMALKLSSRAYVLELGRVTLEQDSASLLDDERIQKSYLGG